MCYFQYLAAVNIRDLFLISLLFFGLKTIAQSPDVKGLVTDYHNENAPDSIRVNAAIALSDQTFFFDLDSTFEMIQKAKEWSTRSNYKKGLSQTDGYLGFLYHHKGEYVTAIDYYTASIEYNLKNGFDVQRAMDLGNYGSLLSELRDEKALGCFRESIYIYEKYNQTNDLSYLNVKLANFYSKTGLVDSSRYYFRKGLEYANNDRAKLYVYGSLVAEFEPDTDQDSVKYYNEKLYDLSIQLGDSTHLQIFYVLQMGFNLEENQLDSVFYYADILSEFSHFFNSNVTVNYYDHLQEAYFRKGDYKNAYTYMDSVNQFMDNKRDIEIRELAFREAVNLEFTQKHFSDSLLFLKEKELKEAEYQSEREIQKQQKFLLYGGLIFFFIVFVIVFNGYRRKKKDNEIISEQKKQVEEQKQLADDRNLAILDSINYAKRIQKAILPSDKAIKKLLPASFILYVPKDIVAGDFYWMEEVEDKKLFAVADCTGHGVPGALVSVICNNALNRSVREYKLIDPGEILDKTRDVVISEFEKSDNVVNDGMDIALCLLQGNTLYFSGAQNPIWIISDEAFKEIKGDKQPIGQYGFSKPFKTHQIQVKKGDLIYLFSDGLVDQFGGPKGKKFKRVAFQSLIMEVKDLPLHVQRERIYAAFQEWKGLDEQIDDICILGIRV